MDLNEKLQYWRQRPKDEGILEHLFLPEEKEILRTICRFEALDHLITQKIEADGEKNSAVEAFIRAEQEKEISFLLKGQFMRQMDILLSKGTVEAWLEIMIWYSLLEEKKILVEDFWEFPAMRAVIDIFMKELDAFIGKREGRISVLTFHNMQELTDAYLKTIFLCRRIEYGIEPMDEIIEYAESKKLSMVFIHGIIDKAQIYNKEKVIKAIEDWY